MTQDWHYVGCHESINFGFARKLPLCASFDYLWDATAMWD